MIQSQARRLYLVEKKEQRVSISSVDDATDQNGALANKSQMRRRFDFGGQSSGVTSPNVQTRKTTRPGALREEEAEPASKRPTIPTPRPRLSLGAIPRRIIDTSSMMKLPLDHRTAFVLMHIDGKTNMRTLIDITGMVPEEVVTMVERLLELHAIAIT